jgi:hypothetical protein
MARTILVEASPWNATSGAVVPTYLAGGGRLAYTHRGRNTWLAGVVSEPQFSARIEFDQNGFSGGARAQFGSLSFSPALKSTRDSIAALFWTGSSIEILVGDDELAVPVWSTLIKGTVAEFSIAEGVVSFTIRDNSGELDDPLVDARFTGAGGIEGDLAVADRLKRRTWGRAFNVEARMLVSAENIFELGNPAFPLQSIDAVKDIGRDASSLTVVTWQGSIAATLAALIAATAPQGGGVVAPSIACVKWWTRPVGPLTADIKGEVGAGYVETVASIAERLVAAKSTLTISNVAAINAIRADAAGIHIGTATETTAQALDRLLKGVSIVWNANAAGVIELSEIKRTSPVETVAVVEVDRIRVYKPMRTRRVGYQRNERIHNDGEISQAQEFLNWLQPSPPTFEETVPGQRWIDTDDNNREYQRTDGFLAIAGTIPTIGGFPILITWRSISDIRIDAALVDAAAAQATANAALAEIADLEARVNAIDDDGILEISEKVDTLIPNAASFEAGYIAISANALAAGVSTTTLDTKRAAWLAFLAAISPAWNDTTQNSPVARGSLDNVRNEYDAELKTVQRLAIEAMTAARTPDLVGNLAWAISGDVAGAVSTSLPVDRRFSAFLGTTDVSPTTNFALSNVSLSLTLSVNNTPGSADRGVVSLEAGTTGSGTATLTATLPGGAVVERIIAVTKTNAIPATGGGAGATFAQDTSFANITSTSHAAISDELTCMSDSSGNVRVAIDLYYSAAGGTSVRTPSFKASYATTPGGSLTDLFAEASGSSCIGGTEPEDGYYTRAEATFAMPAANTNYYFKLQGRRSSGTGNISFNGTSFTVRQ